MQITVFEGFSKRSNSTLRPSSGSVVNCLLKEDTSLQTPTFILHKERKCNYVKWDDNYYYVRNIKYLNNDIIELNCELDLLATYKTNIGSFRGYIARCQTGYNADIVDTCATYTYKWNRVNVAGSGSAGFSNTLYSVMHCLSNCGGHMSINPWYFTDTCQAITSSIMSLENADGLIEKYKETSIDPTRYITRIFQIPWQPQSNGSYAFNICGITSSAPPNTSITKGNTQSSSIVFSLGSALASHEAQTREKCVCHLYLPFYGIYDFSPKYADSSSDNIQVRVYKDDTTGDVAYLILNSGEYIGKVTCNASTESSMGALSYKNSITGIASAGMSMLGTAVGVATANPIGVASGIMGFAQNVVSATTPSVTVCGGLGSNVDRELGLDVLLMVDIPDIVAIDYAGVCGRPLNAVGQISSHGGFVQTAGANISLPMFSSEVSAMMDRGIYYE